jgi:hypothetical protein
MEKMKEGERCEYCGELLKDESDKFLTSTCDNTFLVICFDCHCTLMMLSRTERLHFKNT